MHLKIIICGLFVACAMGVTGAGLAEDEQRQAQAPAASQAQAPSAPADAHLKSLAVEFIEKTLKASNVEEILAELKRTLADVYIPVMREMVQGDYPGAPEANAATASQLAKMLTFMDYMRKAGDELDAAIADNRAAMISDAAEQIARTVTESEIGDGQRLLDLPAVKKALDAFYALSKLVTGFTYADSRKLSEFSAWANGLSLDVTQLVPGTPGGPKSPPTAQKMLKAQGIMDDVLRRSHLDEMAENVRRFAREVFVETAPMSDVERTELRQKIDQFEFMYTMQRAVVIGVAPSAVAASLTDEQLEALQGYVRSAPFTKAFDLIRDAVKAATACTKEDVLEARKALEDVDKKMKLSERGQEQDRLSAQWQALLDKWNEILKNRISPETRRGLEQSFDDLQLRNPPI
jgi:hypothetical protein